MLCDVTSLSVSDYAKAENAHRCGTQQWGRMTTSVVCQRQSQEKCMPKLNHTAKPKGTTRLQCKGHHKNVPRVSVTAASSTPVDSCWASGKQLQPPATPCLHSVICCVLMQDDVSSMEKVYHLERAGTYARRRATSTSHFQKAHSVSERP